MGKGISNTDISERLRIDIQLRKLIFRVASQSWQLDGLSKGMASIASIYAHRLDVCKSRVNDTLIAMQHEQTMEQKRRAEQWVRKSDALPKEELPLRNWLQLIERESTGDMTRKANLLVMKQWLWQVKRALNGLSFTYPVLPIFWSREQGTGKSYNLLRLIDHVKMFTRHLSVDDLGEKFSGEMAVNTYVVFLDEFAGARKADVAKLKALLSGKPVEQRGMFSSGGISGANLMSVIATSNEDPPHGYEDETGARRLWSIHCSGVAMHRNEERRVALDELDLDLVWTAVRSTDESPMLTASRELVEFIEHERECTLRSRSVLENFLNEVCEKVELDFKWPLRDMLKSLREYAMDTKQRVERASYRKTAQALKALGYTVVCSGNVFYMKGMRPKDMDQAAAS